MIKLKARLKCILETVKNKGKHIIVKIGEKQFEATIYSMVDPEIFYILGEDMHTYCVRSYSNEYLHAIKDDYKRDSIHYFKSIKKDINKYLGDKIDIDRCYTEMIYRDSKK